MKRKVMYYANNLMLIDRNHEWLASNVAWRYKLLYYPSIVNCYARMPLRRVRSVMYLGRKFVFDNPATPLNLQNYPFEITNKILANMSAKPVTVLDIGGNVGHFSLTMKHVLGEQAQIDIFEPNKEIFPLLERNVAGLKGVRVFNYALGGKKQKAKMFYEAGRSGTGSMIKENASDQELAVTEISIDMISSVMPLTQRSEYDLVKIDVEGYELEVLKAIKNIQMKYLFVEVSSARSKNYDHSDLFKLIAKQFGEFDIVYASSVSKSAATFDALLCFNPPIRNSPNHPKREV